MTPFAPLVPWSFPPSRFDPVHFLVVGTGGTGGYVIQYLCRLQYALQQQETPFPITLTVMDGDVVEAGNLLRQHFLPQDVGRPKATVLAQRFGAVYHLPVFAVPHYLATVDGLDSFLHSPAHGHFTPSSHPWDVIIGCVDNHATRQLLDQIFHRLAHLIYLDAGNDGVDPSDDPADRETVQASGYGGHVVVGVKQRGRVLLPPVGTVYPDILTDTRSALPGQACGQQAVSQPQRMLTNVWAAMTVMSAVNTLLTDHQVLWHVANFNARYGTTRSQGLTATYWAQLADGA
jgi:hypothetical protein